MVTPPNETAVALGPLPSTPGPLSPSTVSSGHSFNENYSLFHLRLLHHFEHELGAYMESCTPGVHSMLPVFIGQALTTPYLMDELLAYSAAHKSLVDKESRLLYVTEATRLQTRALSLYNSARPEVSDETCLPMFLFSSLLGHHILFDVLNDSYDDLGAVLDGLTRSIGIHRGLSAIARSSWPRFSEELQRKFLSTCVRDGDIDRPTSQNECENLLKRLDKSDLSPSSITVHREAAELLQRLFDGQGHTFAQKTGNVAAIQDWLIGVSADYIQSLNQRRPEALVILAHYGVLLHRGAENWYVGDMGQRIIRLINHHLGPVWADWLEWPGQMVQD